MAGFMVNLSNQQPFFSLIWLQTNVIGWVMANLAWIRETCSIDLIHQSIAQMRTMVLEDLPTKLGH